jgi:uncharacterized radical SAM protein YgiQ
MLDRGWERPDFLFVTGDAYVDHPSFGHAIISRLLEAEGFKVAILAQPDWTSAESFLEFGKPALGALVTSGVVDSMVSHYTAAKKRRSEDDYSPGGKSGRRPDRAVITYCNRLRSALGDTPLIIGGLEAGLRRFSHYDYWDDRVRSSILVNSGADMLVYGMGENAIAEIARRLRGGERLRDMKDIPGTAYPDSEEGLSERRAASEARFIELPSADEVATSKRAYASAFMAEYSEQDPIRGNILFQRSKTGVIVQNPPSPPLTMPEMDAVYALPYERAWHPSYDAMGGVPALEEVKFSVTGHRGCFGGCSFCAITLHQGRIVQKRSFGSVLSEVGLMARLPDFKGYIHDVGGPTANFRNPSCKKQLKRGTCKNRQCLYPRPCRSLDVSHTDCLNLLRKVREAPGVKKVFVRSGVRFDYIMLDSDRAFLRELCEHHVSGQLKVAPEHVSRYVLDYMGKPGSGAAYEGFCREFLKANMKLGKKQYLVPYLISGHPGSALADAVQLSEYLCEKKYSPEQVQDFYPTPGTLSTCMYYTGIDPRTMKKVHIPSGEEKAMQRALLQYRRPENRPLVVKALKLAGRDDLIGFGPECLIRPDGKAGYGGARGKASHGDAGRKAGVQGSARRKAGKPGDAALGKAGGNARGKPGGGKASHGGGTGGKPGYGAADRKTANGGARGGDARGYGGAARKAGAARARRP